MAWPPKPMTSMAAMSRPVRMPGRDMAERISVARPAAYAQKLDQLRPSGPLVPGQHVVAVPRPAIDELVHGERTIREIGGRQLRTSLKPTKITFDLWDQDHRHASPAMCAVRHGDYLLVYCSGLKLGYVVHGYQQLRAAFLPSNMFSRHRPYPRSATHATAKQQLFYASFVPSSVMPVMSTIRCYVQKVGRKNPGSTRSRNTRPLTGTRGRGSALLAAARRRRQISQNSIQEWIDENRHRDPARYGITHSLPRLPMARVPCGFAASHDLRAGFPGAPQRRRIV